MSTMIGFIGLGNMGQPMATNLISAGYKLRVYNRTLAKAETVRQQGATPVAAPHEVAEAGGIVITMLSDDQALEEVALRGNKLAEYLGNGGIHISMSTVAPATARKIAAQHAKHGVSYLAAPVFGRPEAAAARKLWICLSGSAAAKPRVEPILQTLSQGVFDFGEDAGAANVVKLAGNFLIASAIEAMAEVFTLAEKNNIPRAEIARMFGQTLFSSPVYQNYGQKLVEGSYDKAGFKLSLGMKDIALVLQTAKASCMPMPFASLLHDRLLTGFAKGRGELDWAALALGVADDAGLS